MSEHPLPEMRGDYIDGAFAWPDPASGEIRLEEPGDTGLDPGVVPFAREAMDAAVEAARRAYPQWRDASPERRAAALERLATALREDAGRLAEVIAREVGKPVWEARAEVDAMIAKVGITLGPGLERVTEESLDLGGGRRASSRVHPRGVLAVLGPFNFPGHLVHGHVVPALATGNTVVVKPSEHAPATGQVYAELAHRAGLPPGVFNLVQGDGASGAALTAHPDVSGVLFTGSYATGRRILEQTLDAPWKLVALEMGGKNGVLVCADANLDAAAEAIAFGMAVTCGQRCSATSRVIVEAPVADALCERLAHLLEGIRVGYPLADDVFMGPLISQAARQRHAHLLRLAAAEGAESLVAGGPCDGPRPGHYVRPGLHRIRAIDAGSRYQSEEHFVPDAFVVSVGSLEEGIAALDATDYGLAASVFCARRERFERVWRETRLGLLNWNTSTVGASSGLPFGGVGRSGNDRPAGITSVDYCTYPVASIEVESPRAGARHPGFPETV